MNIKQLCAALLLCVFAPIMAYAQTQTVTGTVVDELSEPLIGVSVTAVGASGGTTTDIDGNFTIKVPTTVKQLQFSYVGYQSLTADITPGEALQIALQPASNQLNEVVAIGYGMKKKSDLTGSIATVIIR